ncbi:hypothetical protein BGZ68_002331 [Mortierella alpina]|nr:hypothetical protein BGZ68_002331 [Mortierella alpina]
MAHLTPLALHFMGPTPINIHDLTLGCNDFFKANPPSKWLAEEYIKVDSTFDTGGHEQLELLKQQTSTFLSKEIAKSSTHQAVYDEIRTDNNRRKTALEGGQIHDKLNAQAVPLASFCNDEAEEEEDRTIADSGEGNDVLLPDNTDQAYQFSAVLDGIDIATGFQPLFTAVKKKAIHICDIDQALARSGVILLNKEGSIIQKLHFGETTLDQMREKALAKWRDVEATAGRNQVRAWLDTFEDHGYDREKSRKHIIENAPSDGSYQKLWAYLVSAIEEFPEFDSSKSYSESTAISSFILPLCRAFMSMPSERVILNFIDATTSSGRLRNGSSSRKEPDLALEIKDRTNKTICEVGIGEVTSHAQKAHKKKNAKDLVRVGLSLKDALDFIQDEYDVHDALLVGWQVIGQSMAIYVMFKCGNLYIMAHVRDVIIPDNLTELGTICTQFKIWNDLRATIEQGLRSVLQAVSGTGRMIGNTAPLGSVYARIETTRTPEFKTFLNRA